jgi:hypothetical protein
MKRWKEEGERGTFLGLNVFFIVERVGRGSLGVIFFTNSLWDGGKGAPGGLGCALIFFPFSFFNGGGGWRFRFFFSLHLKCGRKRGKGLIFLLKLFFIVEWLGKGRGLVFLQIYYRERLVESNNFQNTKHS